MTDSIMCTALPGSWFAAARFLNDRGHLIVGLRWESPELTSPTGQLPKFSQWGSQHLTNHLIMMTVRSFAAWLARSFCRNCPTGTKSMAANNLLTVGCLPGGYSRD